MNPTHYYAVAPGRCRYLGSRSAPDPAFSSGTLAPGEQLLAVPQQDQETARAQALRQAQVLITPDLLTWPAGPYLRALREGAGVNQGELGRASGVSLQPIWRLERGDVTNPRYGTLARLAYALGVPLCLLFAPPPQSWPASGEPLRPVDASLQPGLETWAGGPGISLRRAAANLAQVELAQATGLTAKQLSVIETGEALDRSDEPSPTRGLALIHARPAPSPLQAR